MKVIKSIKTRIALANETQSEILKPKCHMAFQTVEKLSLNLEHKHSYIKPYKTKMWQKAVNLNIDCIQVEWELKY